MTPGHKKYTAENVRAALKKIENGMSIYRAAKLYNVPKTTLINKRNGKFSIEKK